MKNEDCCEIPDITCSEKYFAGIYFFIVHDLKNMYDVVDFIFLCRIAACASDELRLPRTMLVLLRR